MIENKDMGLKHKDFTIALYLMGMHSNKAEAQAVLY